MEVEEGGVRVVDNANAAGLGRENREKERRFWTMRTVPCMTVILCVVCYWVISGSHVVILGRRLGWPAQKHVAGSRLGKRDAGRQGVRARQTGFKRAAP